MNETSETRSRRLRELRGGHSYAYVLALVVASFLWIAISPNTNWFRGVVLMLEIATLVVALWTSREGPPAIRYLLISIGAVFAVAALAIEGRGLEAATGIVAGLLIFAIVIVIGRGVVSQGVVNQQSVIGAVCVYVLLGMLFMFVYSVVAVLGSGPFFAQGTDGTPALRMYFSYVTLTTVGYGDYTAASNLGHTLAITEALLGQLYLVTVVAVLVSRIGKGTRPGSAEDE